MMVRLLYTTGLGKFSEMDWNKPEITDDEIEVKAIYTGVCRSDIAMMQGDFGLLPLHMQGHEGLGKVTKIGKNVKEGVRLGDYVATRGEPGYADYYNVKLDQFVVVPKAEPKYILEPVACGINLINQSLNLINQKKDQRMLILGSGFLSYVAYRATQIILRNYVSEIDIVGSHNSEIWGDRLKPVPTGKYDIIVDLTSKNLVFEKIYFKNCQ